MALAIEGLVAVVAAPVVEMAMRMMTSCPLIGLGCPCPSTKALQMIYNLLTPQS
jgi:hypothetical protein